MNESDWPYYYWYHMREDLPESSPEEQPEVRESDELTIVEDGSCTFEK